jgi:uncharacterized protein (DUF4415 family)
MVYRWGFKRTTSGHPQDTGFAGADAHVSSHRMKHPPIKRAALKTKFESASRQARPVKPRAPKKVLICLRLDRDVLDWFKSRGPGYQTRINTVLRAFRDASL